MSVRRTRDSKGIRSVPIIATASLVAFFSWAAWANLDQVSRATGQVIPSNKVQVLQSTDGGVISEIRVREGDIVKRGDVLIHLDTVKLDASVKESDAKAAALSATMARIEAELFDRPLVFPPELERYPDFVANQRLLYAKRRGSFLSEMKALSEMQVLIRKELELNQPLLESGDVSRTEVLRLERSLVDVRGQIMSRRAKYLQDLQAEYTKTAEDLVAAQQSLTQRSDALKDTSMIAPTDGIIKNVRFTTVGAVLRPGDEVLQIVPTGEELIVEAKVSPTDIAFVRPGQSAKIKFDAYDYSIYGTAGGKVSYISPDTLTEQHANGDIVYYRVHVKVSVQGMRPHKPGEIIRIQPGMTATVEIKTGENTVLRYLTKPILKTTSEALQER